MARIRTIKPSFFESPTVARLPHRARLTFVGLWTYVDDKGRGFDDARLVKAAVWPLDDDVAPTDVADDLDRIEAEQLIERWHEAELGRDLLRVRSFLEHQRINRATVSKLPPSPEESRTAPGGLTEPDVSTHAADAPVPHRILTEHSPPEVGSGREAEAERRAGDVDAIDRETQRRIAERRMNGERIGPKLEQLIRGDVERDLAVLTPAPPPQRCQACRETNGMIEVAAGRYDRCTHELAA